MIFKDPSLENEFNNDIPIFLKFIVEDADEFCRLHFNKEIIVTRVLEKVCGSSGVHEAHRAVDIRDEHDGSFFFTADESQLLMDYINGKYKRNDKLETLIFHSFNSGPRHGHIQVAFTMDNYIPSYEEKR